MFYSLVQTLVCVLLINGGLYALHLKSNGDATSTSSISNGNSVNEPAVFLAGTQLQPLNPNREHVQHAGGVSFKQYENAAGRLNEELADLAQLDRERLMLLGIAKQTAAANAAAATEHHGRPFITGRIHMSPTEDLVSDGDYASLLMPQLPRGYMFGHVVKQPISHDENPALTSEFTGSAVDAVGTNMRPVRYEYGRVVQPAVEPEYDSQHMPLDLDSFVELEQEPEQNEDDFDMDGYQYLDELLAEQQQREWQEAGHHRPSNPYQNFEDVNTPIDLRELFHKEHHKQSGHQQSPNEAQTRSGFNPSNMRLQPKWQRKRAQQLPQHHNMFGQKKQHQQQLQQLQQTQQQSTDDQIQPHYFNQRHHSLLSSIGSEATANKNNNDNDKMKLDSVLDENLKTDVNPMYNSHNTEEKSLEQHEQQQSVLEKSNSPIPAVNNVQHQQQSQQTESRLKEKLLLHPNRKRSGGGLIPPGLTAAGSHSLASQLMLRSARGQRQYDVPQIGKSSILQTLHILINFLNPNAI